MPWLARLPSMMSAVSAWASKWTMPDVAVPVDVGDGGGRRPRDRVVAAEDDRHDAPLRDLGHALADVGVADLGLAVRAVGVTEVDDLQPVEDLQAEVHVVRARLVGGGADGPRPEAGTGAVRRRDVERRADDGDVRLPLVELLDVGQERALAERRDPGQVELLLHAGGQLPSRLVIASVGGAHAPEPIGASRRPHANLNRRGRTVTSMTETMSAAVAPFYAIHRKMRIDTRRYVMAVETATEADRSGRLVPLAKWAAGFGRELHLHHTVEDDHFFPALVERSPEAGEILAGLEHDHEVVAGILKQWGPAARDLADPTVDFETARAEVLALAVQLRDLLAEHLDIEDAQIVPRFDEALHGGRAGGHRRPGQEVAAQEGALVRRPVERRGVRPGRPRRAGPHGAVRPAPAVPHPRATLRPSRRRGVRRHPRAAPRLSRPRASPAGRGPAYRGGAVRWKLGCALSAITVGAVTIGTSLALSDPTIRPAPPATATARGPSAPPIASWTGTMVVGATGFPDAVVVTDSASPSTPSSVFLDRDDAVRGRVRGLRSGRGRRQRPVGLGRRRRGPVGDDADVRRGDAVGGVGLGVRRRRHRRRPGRRHRARRSC